MVRLLKIIQKPISVIILGGVLVFLVITSLRAGGSIESLELAAYDWFIRLEPKIINDDPKITFIQISEDDIHAYGRWPLSDEIVAKALKIMLKSNPCAIGIDIYRDIPVPPGRMELDDVLSKNPNIVTVMTFGVKGVKAPEVVRGTDQVGFGDIIVDSGGIVRRALLFMDDGKKIYSSFAFRLASLYLQSEGVTPASDPGNPQFIRLKNTTIIPFESNDGGYINADARGYQFLLDYKDADSSFRFYSFSNLLSGKVPAKSITDKIILIGVSSKSVKDFFYTPLSRGFVEDQQTPGIVLHGQITSQLLRFSLNGTSPIKTMSKMSEAFWILCWSLAGAVIGLRTRSVWRFSAIIMCGLVILFFTTFIIFLAKWWVPLVPPALSFSISASFVTAYVSSREKEQRAHLMELFSKHVSEEIAEIIWEQRDQFLNDGRPRSQKMTATVFFSDLRGFTAMSEKMDPQDLIDWLNAYMEPMTRLIMEHGGVIDDYAGDGIKANFGVPLPRKNENEVCRDAVNAIICALAMEKEMRRLNTIWSEKGLPTMRTRIGIYTGPVVAGLLGSAKRFKYTTVGDTVNIASRLENYDKEVDKDSICRILIGESTLRYLDLRFKTERIGEVSLKGKYKKITVHSVLGENLPGVEELS